jgi:hypothetical protein
MGLIGLTVGALRRWTGPGGEETVAQIEGILFQPGGDRRLRDVVAFSPLPLSTCRTGRHVRRGFTWNTT